MEDPSESHEAMTSGSIQINVERMMGGTGGLGGQATHGGTGGTGGHGQGARLIENLKAEKVFIHNHGDAEGVNNMELEAKLEKWLNAPDPKEKQSHFCGLENRSPCSWLFEDTRFILWQNNSGELLWIEGASGTGKTIVSSMIIEQLFKDRASPNDITAVAYFYFDFTDLGKQSVENMLRCLVLQLSHQSPARYATLTQHYNSCKGQTIPTYPELLVILEKLLRTLGRTYIVLDALDECKATDYDRVVEFIQKMSGWLDVQLHILVTSQPRDVFEKKFLSFKALSRITVQADTTSDDIRLYISSELASRSELQIWKPEQGLITNYIADKSAGMFRLAYCLLEQLKECARLDDLQEVLVSLPDNLHDIYARSIRSIPQKHLSDVQRLLNWLAFSAQPLTLAELEDTIAFDFSDPVRYKFHPRKRPKRGIFLKWLSVLVSIQSSQRVSWGGHIVEEEMFDLDGFYRGNCTVSLAHSSVQDYLLLEQKKHPSSCSACPIHVIEKAAHRLMAQTCVCYLLHFADHPLNAQTFPNYPLAIYAAKNWCYHLLRCTDQVALSTLTMGLLEVGSSQYTALNQLHWGNYPDWLSFIDPPLYLCAVLGYIEGVKFLLDRGADANAVGRCFGNFDDTALQAASASGHLAIVRLLLEKGADVNAGDRGATALQLASRHCHIEIIRLLLEKGADVNAGNDINYSALQLTSLHGHLHCVHLLLVNGAAINVNDEDTPLQLASQEGHIEIVKLLLKSGADVNAMSEINHSALQLASLQGHLDCVRLLLENGANINVNKEGTPLQLASKKGHIGIVKLLLEMGADVNAQARWHGTALQCALRKNHVEIVNLLLEHGAIPSVNDFWSDSASDEE